MQGRYRETNQSKSKTRFFLLLTVVFLIVLFKWGIPTFLNIVSDTGESKPQKASKDIIPPQTPFMSALPDATNSAQIFLDGYTESDVNLEIYLNSDQPIKDRSDKDGNFKIPVKLVLGKNTIIVKAIDAAGNSSQSEVKQVEYDNKPVELTLESPTEGQEIFGRANQVLEVKGKVNKPELSVWVNNSFSSSDKQGNFSYKFSLVQGENIIKVMAADKAGNTAERQVKVIFNL